MKLAHKHYPDYANPELLDKIPLNARTVLDVGCAQGALGAAYLRRNPTCRVLGIDVDEAAVAQARLRLTEAVCGDVEQMPMPFEVPPGGIDCIIYGDVLEHLADPWALVAEHVKYLAPQGTVLVCMPNVEHWSFVARLLTGSFDYEEQGLFDKTHLRWFTPRTMGALLSAAGLSLADLAPRPASTEQASQFVQALAPGLKAIGVDPQEYFNRAGPIQFLWRARRSHPGNIEVSATMLAPQGGVSDVRVIEPMRALSTDSRMVANVVPEEAISPAAAGMPRIAVIHRPLMSGAAGRERIRRLLAKGYLVVTEFDDHPIFMEERGLDMDQMLTFRGVHAIQTSTVPLAEVLLAHNPEVAVFPNGVFELPAVHNFADPEQMTFFFGAINRQADWAPYMPVLNEVARAVGSRLRFQVLLDEGFFNALETPHKNFEPMADYANYKKHLCQAEISFMPLGDTVFNRAKSDLKFIEAGAARVAALASPTVYAGVIEDGKTGLIFRDPAELRSSLLRLLAYPEASKRMAEAARAYVASKRMLAYQVGARIDWYRSLWDRREELNEALKARVPDLFT